LSKHHPTASYLKPGFHPNAIAIALRVLRLDGNRAKRKRLRWHGSQSWLPLLRPNILLAAACSPVSIQTQRKRLRLDGNRALDSLLQGDGNRA